MTAARVLCTGLMMLASTAAGSAQEPALDGRIRLTLDPSHSSASFAIRHLGLSKVRGHFSDVQGTIYYDPDAIERSSLTVVIGSASINTANQRRDDDLRENFFVVDSFPTLTFQSTAIERNRDGYLMTGDLRIKDTTRTVRFPVEYIGERTDEAGMLRRVAFEGELDIERKDYGVYKEGHPAEMRLVIGDEVEIELSVEAFQRDFAAIGFNSREKPSIGEALWERVGEEGEDWDEILVGLYQRLKTEEPEGYNFSVRELLVLQGRLLQHGHYEAAAEVGELAAREHPESATPLELAAEAYARDGRHDEALAACERALERDPRSTSAMELRRLLSNRTGELGMN